MQDKTKTPLQDSCFFDFPVKAPAKFNFATDVLDKWAEFDRNKLAMIWVNQQGEERRYTFYDFHKLSIEAANNLVKLGVSKGDKVFLMLPRMVEWWIFSLAMIRIGAIQCPSPTLLTPEDVKYRVNAGKFKVVITDSENAPKFDEVYDLCPGLKTKIIVNDRRPEWNSYLDVVEKKISVSNRQVNLTKPFKSDSKQTLLYLFTSGTSKHPKMVEHTYDMVLGHRITAELWHNLGPNDLHFTVSDTGWGKNIWGNYFGQWILGACVFIYDIRGKFHADELLPLLEKYSITSFCAPPTIYRMMVLNDLRKFDLRDLKHSCSAGEPIHTETVKAWKEGTGLEIREAYGQTETVCMIGNFEDCPLKEGSMGKAAPGWDIDLLDDDGNKVAEGEEGRIAINLKNGKPVGLFTKYVGSDEENAKCFEGDYYFTGDKAYRDKDGYFFFVGRSDDIIKSSGYRISPMEVEEVMMQHPAVHEVAVVAAPDPLRGAKVKAYVVLHKGFEATDSMVKKLQQHVKESTAPYKYPREIEFVKSMPKTFSGKIKRDLLRKHAETGIYWGKK